MAPRTKAGQTINVEDVFPSTQSTQLNTVHVPEPGPEPIEYDDVTALNNVLAELGADEEGGGFVVVNREDIQPNGKRDDVYIDRFPASEFSLENLKARWGAGRYKISVYHSGGIGLATRKVITIAKDPNAIVPAAPAPVATDLTPILQTMQQGFEKMIQVMLASQTKAPTRAETMQELMMMREVFAPAQNTQQQNFNPVEMMKLGIEMAQSGSGGGENNNSWINKMLETFGPALTPAITGALTPKEHAPMNIPGQRQIAAPVARPDPLIEQPQPEDNPMNIMMTQYLNFLKSAAAKNAPVEEYADSILNSIPESAVADLEAILRPDNWRDQLRLKTLVADQYPVWFTALRNTLLTYIDEDRAEPEVTTHLTPVIGSDSVVSHENANTGNDGKPEGDTASAA